MKRRQPLSTSTRFAGVVAALRAAADWLRQAGRKPPRIEEDDARALGELYLQCRCYLAPAVQSAGGRVVDIIIRLDMFSCST